MTTGVLGGAAGWRRGYGVLIGASALAVALADWLFYDHPVGWTAGLFAAFLLGLLALRGGGFLATWAGRAVAVCAGGLVAALVEEPTPPAIVMCALAVMMLAVLNRNAWPGGVGQWTLRLVESFGVGLLRVVTDNRIAVRWMRRHPLSVAGPMRSLVTWLLPLALGAVFVALFRAANPVFSRIVGSALQWLGELLSGLTWLVDLPRNVLWLCVGAGVYALLRVRRCRRRGVMAETGAPPGEVPWQIGDGARPTTYGGSRDERRLPESAAVPARGETAGGGAGNERERHYTLAPPAISATGVIVRCLVLFNALFALQNALDVMYLFGGATLPEGMTHAEYAHRGAYPLVATALLAAAFVLLAFRPGGPAERSTLARRLVYAWVAQNVFLTVTAAWRLDLYVGVYSLTRLRVAAGLWMMLVAAGLVWIGCRIVFRRDNAWLLNANVLTAAAVLYGCCFVNIDKCIADYNVEHCRETGGGGVAIDVDYLRGLGPDALPALRRLAPLLPPAEHRGETLAHVEALEQELHDDLSSWRGWTLRRARLGRGAAEDPAFAPGDSVGVTLVSPSSARDLEGDTSVAPTKTLTPALSGRTGRGGSQW